MTHMQNFHDYVRIHSAPLTAFIGQPTNGTDICERQNHDGYLLTTARVKNAHSVQIFNELTLCASLVEG